MAAQQRPPFPPHLASSSISSSPFQSSSSLSSITSTSSSMSSQPSSSHHQMQEYGHHSAAPLPSPRHPTQQFAGFEQSFALQQQQMQMQMQMQQQHQQTQDQRQCHPGAEQLQRYSSFEYKPDRGDSGSSNPETARFLNDFGLLAEAAKRAQMAVLMRDFEGCEL